MHASHHASQHVLIQCSTFVVSCRVTLSFIRLDSLLSFHDQAKANRESKRRDGTCPFESRTYDVIDTGVSVCIVWNQQSFYANLCLAILQQKLLSSH